MFISFEILVVRLLENRKLNKVMYVCMYSVCMNVQACVIDFLISQ